MVLGKLPSSLAPVSVPEDGSGISRELTQEFYVRHITDIPPSRVLGYSVRRTLQQISPPAAGSGKCRSNYLGLHVSAQEVRLHLGGCRRSGIGSLTS
jgi:hypothetical protein